MCCYIFPVALTRFYALSAFEFVLTFLEVMPSRCFWPHLWHNCYSCRVCCQRSNFLYLSVWVLICILVIVLPQDNLAPSFRLAIAQPIWPVWAEDRGATQNPPPCTLWDWRQPRSCQSSIWWPSNCQGNIFLPSQFWATYCSHFSFLSSCLVFLFKFCSKVLGPRMSKDFYRTKSRFMFWISES